MNRPNYGTKTAGGNPRIYNCRVCDRAFTREEHLTRHTQSTHNKLKPFCCGICSRPFSRRDLLLRHAKNLHQGSELAVSRIRRLYKRAGPGGDPISNSGPDAGIMGEDESPENSPSYGSPASPELGPSLPMTTSSSTSSLIPHLAYKQSTSAFQSSASTLLAAAAAASSSLPKDTANPMNNPPQMRVRSVSNPTSLPPLMGIPINSVHRRMSNQEITTFSERIPSNKSNNSNNIISSTYPMYSKVPTVHHHHNNNNINNKNKINNNSNNMISNNHHHNMHMQLSNSFSSATIPPLYPSTYTTAPPLMSPVMPSTLPSINSHTKLPDPSEASPQTGLGATTVSSPIEEDGAEAMNSTPTKKGKKKQKMSVQMLVS